VLLTHAHLDHCGRLPLLVKRGFRGQIVATGATRDLARLVLLDVAHVQEEDAERRQRQTRRRGREPEIVDEIEQFLTGSRAQTELDRVLATVMFTDIVDSTSHAAALGDRAWRRLLDRHNDVVRQEIERFRGRTVKNLGDGFLATFDGPARAVRCAAAISDRMHPLGIQVRSGLHTGEIELTPDDVAGIAVHIAARVAEKAGAGEVLVSSMVRDLVAGSGLHFGDRGSHALKGFPEPLRLFAAEL
jgi:class 3 adenylate cyclase